MFLIAGIVDWFLEIWYTMWLFLCQGIYIFIGYLYEVFQSVASVNLFSEEIFEKITGRIYVVVGVAVLFVFAYNIILAIINPDGKDNGTKGLKDSVKETVISLVIVALLPSIFNWMYIFQTNVLKSEIIPTIILGGSGVGRPDSSNCAPNDYECDCKFDGYSLDEYQNNKWWFWQDKTDDYTEFLEDKCDNYFRLPPSVRGAYMVAPTIFSAFYKPTNYTFEECADYLYSDSSSVITDPTDKKICVNYFVDVLASKYSGNLGIFVEDDYLLDIVSDTDKDNMRFDNLMAVVAGVLAIYMFFCYSMEIGVRVAKLGFLQLISPIPVMMRIIPGQKAKIFDKWFNQLKNTYLDVFIRLAIIYFCLFGVSLVPDVLDTLWSSLGAASGGTFVKMLSSVFVILGILKFAGDAPGLFKEFFGGSGQFALKSPSKQLKENKIGAGAIGMVGGGLASGVGNVWNAGKNVKNASGFKNKGKEFLKGVGKTTTGTIGGAVRGAKHSYGAEGFKDLGHRVAEAKYATDASQERGFGGMLKYNAKKIKTGLQDLGNVITGEGATNFRLKAAEAAISDIKNINANFTNGRISGIEEAFSKMSAKHLNGEDLNFRGKEYKKVGNEWVNKNDDKDRVSDKKMRDDIKEYFDGLKKAEFVSQYMATENERAFDRLTSKMVSTLTESLPKMSSEFIDVMNDKLKKTGIKFNNIEEITTKIEELSREHTTASREQLYDIFDAADKSFSAAKKEDLVALQEKKDKK